MITSSQHWMKAATTASVTVDSVLVGGCLEWSTTVRLCRLVPGGAAMFLFVGTSLSVQPKSLVLFTMWIQVAHLIPVISLRMISQVGKSFALPRMMITSAITSSFTWVSAIKVPISSDMILIGSSLMCTSVQSIATILLVAIIFRSAAGISIAGCLVHLAKTQRRRTVTIPVTPFMVSPRNMDSKITCNMESTTCKMVSLGIGRRMSGILGRSLIQPTTCTQATMWILPSSQIGIHHPGQSGRSLGALLVAIAPQSLWKVALLRIAENFSLDGLAGILLSPIIPLAIAPRHVGFAPDIPLTSTWVTRTLMATVARSTTRCQYCVTSQMHMMMMISLQVSTVLCVVEETAMLASQVMSSGGLDQVMV